MAKLICIDAGHGGKDSGAVGNGLQEKDITLSIAKKVGVYLENNGLDTLYTRTTDIFPSLSERYTIANNAKADAFISIHCNAYGAGNGTAYGMETYCYKFTNRKLADAVHNSMLEDTSLYRKNRGVKEGNFAVLVNSNMDACLIETGFIDNALDSVILANKQDEFAKQIAKGICNYLGISFKDKTEEDTPVITPPKPTIIDWTNIYPNKRSENEYVYEGTGLTSGYYDVYLEISNEYGIATSEPFTLTIPNTALPLQVENREISITLDEYVNTQKGKLAVISKNNTFVNATLEEIKEYANPDRYSITDSNYKWQHLKLNNYTPISVDKLNTFLNSKNPTTGKTPVFHNKAQAFISACMKYNVDAIYFVSHACLETGWGGSALAQGYDVVLDDNGNAKRDSEGFVVLKDSSTPTDAKLQRVHNLFGIGAVDGNVQKGGTTKAYDEGWFTIDRAIEGGCKWISEGYINSAKYTHQNTLYFMRWDYINSWHQYSTDVGWAEKQANLMSQMSHCRLNGEEGLVLIYPKFKEVSKTPTTEYITTSAINIRKTPAWAGEVIRVASKGETLYVTNFTHTEHWAEVVDNGILGYVPNEHIQKK